MILFLISWFLVGFLSIVFACIKDMRGKEFDPNYFNEDIGVILFLIAFGYISVIIEMLQLFHCTLSNNFSRYTLLM